MAAPKRKRERLTVAALAAALPGSILEDGGGLRFVAAGAGVGRWVYRYSSPVHLGKRREKGLGPARATQASIDAARKIAADLRDQIDHGCDPLQEASDAATAKRAQLVADAGDAKRQAATLDALWIETAASLKPTFKNTKHAQQWLDSRLYLSDRLRAKAACDITVNDLLTELVPLCRNLPETGRRVYQRAAATLDAAALRGLVDRNVATLMRRELTKLAPRPEKVHHRSIDFKLMPAFVASIKGNQNISMSVRLAMLMIAATATRSGETRLATWSEIDLDNEVWVIPAPRMKRGKEHRVPLNDLALYVLSEAEALRPLKPSPSDLVFPSVVDRAKPLSDMALGMALRRARTGRQRAGGVDEVWDDLLVPHGIRSAFSAFGNRHASPDVVEASLAHELPGNAVRRAYLRDEFWNERLELMRAWSKFLTTTPANVVRMPRKAG
jgi:integrase